MNVYFSNEDNDWKLDFVIDHSFKPAEKVREDHQIMKLTAAEFVTKMGMGKVYAWVTEKVPPKGILGAAGLIPRYKPAMQVMRKLSHNRLSFSETESLFTDKSTESIASRLLDDKGHKSDKSSNTAPVESPPASLASGKSSTKSSNVLARYSSYDDLYRLYGEYDMYYDDVHDDIRDIAEHYFRKGYQKGYKLAKRKRVRH